MARHCEDSRGSPVIAERRAFGERLRRQRRHQNLSLTEIAASTKVGASHYAALERGDCSRWPGGVYNRAFIRAYAKAVGLDPDETAAEFAECFESAPAPELVDEAVDPALGYRRQAPAAPRYRAGSSRHREAGRPHRRAPSPGSHGGSRAGRSGTALHHRELLDLPRRRQHRIPDAVARRRFGASFESTRQTTDRVAERREPRGRTVVDHHAALISSTPRYAADFRPEPYQCRRCQA